MDKQLAWTGVLFTVSYGFFLYRLLRKDKSRLLRAYPYILWAIAIAMAVCIVNYGK